MNTDPRQLKGTARNNIAMQVNIAYAGVDFRELLAEEMPGVYNFINFDTYAGFESAIKSASVWEHPEIIIIEADLEQKCFDLVNAVRKNDYLQDAIIIILSKFESKKLKAKALELHVHDYYVYPFSVNFLHERIKLLLKLRLIKPYQLHHKFSDTGKDFIYKMPVSKRVFDVTVAALILIMLSPLLLLVGLIVRLESKGPVIYRSRRVGAGYKIFNFYKFRSMVSNADQQVGDFENLNLYLNEQQDTGKAVFFKVMNDPRITRFGRFIRNTSIDELPQLFNILVGDMSFVGNRPLPLYEAERLTSNEWSMRFLGPAGLTGLWQIKQRGKKDITEQERKELDNYYAKTHSFKTDLEIMFKTLPALIQKTRV